jgi:acyl-CoA dehydrogenase
MVFDRSLLSDLWSSFRVIGKTDPHTPRQLQQSMIADNYGYSQPKVNPLFWSIYRTVQPQGHDELLLGSVGVISENVLLGKGFGFEIAQGRLVSGKIHHCIRLIRRRFFRLRSNHHMDMIRRNFKLY